MRDEGSEEGGGTDLIEGYRSCELHGWASGPRGRLAVLAYHQDERSKCCEDTSCKVFPLPAVSECRGEPRRDMECVREGLYARGGRLFVSHGGLVREGEGEWYLSECE